VTAIELNPLPFGNYYLLERLAVGGMAEVYLAKCFGVAGFERLVALKRILPTIAEDDEFIAMFIDEAKIAGQLSHANIAQIFDLGKIHSGYFIAMEYISGHDLRALWDRAPDSGGLPIELCCYVVKKLCEGLDYAHRRRDNRGRPLGIIHRDVSPQNVLLSYDGDLKVIDFGIAKAANRMVRTQTGILKGKFAYMAPEQAKGEPTDHRADVFAIGVILYELITGERAFKAATDFALLEKVRRVDITPPRKLRPEVPRDLEKVIYKAMGKEPGDRYAWASGLAADLDRFMSEHDLRYNKEELGAYVRRTFKAEHEEEGRRLKLYQGFKPEHLDDDMLIASPDDLRVAPDNPTVVRADPSLEDLGTELNEGKRVRAKSPLGEDATEESGEQRQPGFEAGYTLPIDDMPRRPGPTEDEDDDDDDDDGAATDADRKRPRSRVRALDDKPPWQTQNVPRATPSTQVNISQPDFSDEGESESPDETMVDSGPLDEEEEPARGLPQLPADRRGGGRPEVRGASLSHVLGASQEARPRITGPVEAPSAIGSGRVSANGARAAARSAPRVETENFDDRRLRPARGVEPARVAVFASAALVLGAVLGGVIGWLGGGGATGSANTFIVVDPRAASVSLGELLLCEVTPCAVSLPRGRHELTFRTPNRAETKVWDIGGENTVIDLKLELPIAGLRVLSNPPGAKVWLDGEPLRGKTPLSLPELRVGQEIKLRVEAASADFDVVEDLVEIDGRGLPLQFDLPAKVTEWTVTVDPEDATLFAAGARPRPKRVRPTISRGDSLIVVARRPGCEEKTVVLEGDGQPKAEQRIELACRVFDARLSVFGLRGTEVQVDGIELGRRVPVKEFAIPSGEHLVLARRRGKQTPYLVQVVPGQTATVNTKVK